MLFTTQINITEINSNRCAPQEFKSLTVCNDSLVLTHYPRINDHHNRLLQPPTRSLIERLFASLQYPFVGTYSNLLILFYFLRTVVVVDVRSTFGRLHCFDKQRTVSISSSEMVPCYVQQWLK